MIRGTSKRRTVSRQSRKGMGRKKVSQNSCTKDEMPILTASYGDSCFALTNGSPLPAVSVPSSEAVLPKPSQCSCLMRDKGIPGICIKHPKEQSKENLPCNNVILSHSPHAIKTKSGKPLCYTFFSSPVGKSGTRKTHTEERKNHLVTEYFPVRRSNRKTLQDVKKEKQKTIEEAILSAKEDGFEVKEFPGKGRGVITLKRLKRGDFVLEYYGELIDMEEAKKREELYAAKENTGCYMYYFKCDDKQYCIDATKESGRLGRLVNHSKKGNLKTQPFLIDDSPHLILVACRDIDPGEELLYDYGDRSKKSLESHPWLAL